MIVQVLPAWWRTAQCMRRYYDTWKVKPHLLNAGKYASFFLVSMMFAASDATKGTYGGSQLNRLCAIMQKT